LLFKQADAQLSISFNISSQPKWGPVGYNYVQYYYFPDIDCYYYVPTSQFIYQSGTQWIYSSSLPPMYRNFDLYNGYKVVINDPRPYLHNSIYRSRYASYRGRRGQSIIRDSHDPRYRPGYRPGNNRPPVKPKPPGNGGVPTRPGNGNKPGPGNGGGHTKPGNGGVPTRPGNGGKPGNGGVPTRPGNGGKPDNGGGRPQQKQDDNNRK
jgi:hypothetical protein